MRARSLVAAVATLILIVFGRVGTAHADVRTDVAKKIKSAMESYDSMDYDVARKLLNQALATAKKGRLDKDPLTARAYLDLGIVSFANGDTDAAKLSFLSAVQIDPKIEIDAAYRSDDIAKLLDQARAETAGAATTGGSGGAVSADGPDCTTITGLQHTVIDTAHANAPLEVKAFLGPEVHATKVAVMYRPEGATDFSEVTMTKQGECGYDATIPAAGMHGSLVHYYVAALGDNGKPVAAKGSAGSPNIIELTAGAVASSGGSGDTEDPMNEGGDKTGGGSVSSHVTVGPRPARLEIGVSAGTGFGYVTGTTEAMNQVKNCCIGNSLVVITPEVAYHVNARTAIGLAARIGLPLGANVAGHATAAPGGLLRVRYALSDSGDGVRVMGQIGAGILRNTIKLDNGMTGMDTDVVAQGPLLLGAGIGFTKHLSGTVSIFGDLSALAGIAVVDHLSSAPRLNSGVAADLSLGVALGF